MASLKAFAPARLQAFKAGAKPIRSVAPRSRRSVVVEARQHAAGKARNKDAAWVAQRALDWAVGSACGLPSLTAHVAAATMGFWTLIDGSAVKRLRNEGLQRAISSQRLVAGVAPS